MTRRRILITLWPYTGHLLPQMSIAVALRERGHEVAFYSGEAARERIEGAGFPFFGFQRVDEGRVTELVESIDVGQRRTRPGGGRLLSAYREWLVETIPAQVDDLRPIIAQWRPDAIATDLSMWAPIVVLGETERIPVALSSTFMGPLIPGPDAPPPGLGLRPPRGPLGRAGARALTAVGDLLSSPLRKRVNQLRVGYGLAPLRESINAHTGRLPLYLVGNIRELDFNRDDLPDTVHYVGNCIWFPDDATSEPFLAEIPTERPWVHVTESTLASGDPFLSRTAIEALADQPVELIVTTGGGRDPQALGLKASAPNVHLIRWVRHDELLPRCAAVVTVGGPATVVATIAAGVPLVIVPTSWDKPDNARRVAEAGAGVRLSARSATPQALRQAVRQVLYDPRYRETAQELGARIAAAPGPARAAELLEALAGGAGSGGEGRRDAVAAAAAAGHGEEANR